MDDKNENIPREIESIKKNQVKIFQITSLISEIKNILF